MVYTDTWVASATSDATRSTGRWGAWNETLSEEVDTSPGTGDDDRYIADISDQPGPGPYYNVTLTFERGVDYRLQMAKAGVGTRVSDENATYITNNTPTSVSITTSETVDLVVEARDDYNNPVADRTVYADVAGSSRQVATDEDGQATISVDGSALGTGTYTVETSLTSIGGDYDLDGQRNVSFTVDVSSSSGGGGGSGSAYSLNWDNPTADNPNAELSDCSTTGCTWNVGASSDDTLTLRSGTMPALGGFDVEYAVDNTTVGAVSPPDDATGPDGESTTDFTASQNGTAAIYAASGGSSDLFNLTVENVSADGGGGGSTQTLEYQRLNKGDSGVAYFDIENTGSQVTVTDVAVDWSGSGSKTIDNSDSPEISIRPDSGQTGEANNGPYDANGDNIQLTPDAVIDSGTAAEVDIRVIEQGNNAENFDLQQVDSADQADLTIALTLDGETDQVYYFEDTS